MEVVEDKLILMGMVGEDKRLAGVEGMEVVDSLLN